MLFVVIERLGERKPARGTAAVAPEPRPVLGIMMFPRMLTRVSMTAVCLLSAACLVGPNYVKPVVPAPDTFRALRPRPSPASLADAKWWDVFADEQLQALVRTATTQNYDVRIAATRVEQAEAQLGISRSNQYPTVAVDLQAGGQRTPEIGTTEARTAAAVGLRGRVAWELDFWGRYRRGNEAARARLLASEWGQRAVMSTLVSRVADAYFTLRSLDLQLDVARRTLASRNESLDLARIREQGGATSMVDVRQAEQLVYNAAGTIADFERRIEQQENFISVLLGGIPWGGDARPRTDRPAARAGSAGGAAVVAARTAARHPGCRAGHRRRQCRDWRRSSRLLPLDHADRKRRRPEHGARVAVQRRRGRMDGGGGPHPAALHRRPDQIAGGVRGSRARRRRRSATSKR